MTRFSPLLQSALIITAMIGASAFAQNQSQGPVSMSPDAPNRIIPSAERRFALDVYAGFTGSWYAPGEGGSGWFFAPVSVVSSTGNEFLSLTQFSYAPSGAPFWQLATQPLPTVNRLPVPANMDQPFAVFDGALNSGLGGGCPTCPFRTATVGSSVYGNVRMTWETPTFARVTVQGQEVSPIQPSDFLVGESFFNRLRGTHEVVIRQRQFAGATIVDRKCIYDLRPSSAPAAVWEREAAVPLSSVPTPGMSWLRLFGACSPGFSSSEGFPPGPLVAVDTYFAADPALPGVALVITLRTTGMFASVAPIPGGFRILNQGYGGRIYATGASEMVEIGFNQHDRNAVSYEASWRKAGSR